MGEEKDKVNSGQIAEAFRRIFKASRIGGRVDGTREGPPPPSDTELPVDNFVEGWSAERLLRHLVGQSPKQDDVTHLDEYSDVARSQSQRKEAVLKLGQRQHVVAFPDNLVLLFASLDQDRIDTLGSLADWTPDIVSTLHRLAQEEIERGIKRELWSKAWKVTRAGAVLAFGVAKWGWEVWVWASSTFPGLISEASKWTLGLIK